MRCTAIVLGLLIPLAGAALAAAAPQEEASFFRPEELTPDVALVGKEFHVPTVFPISGSPSTATARTTTP